MELKPKCKKCSEMIYDNNGNLKFNDGIEFDQISKTYYCKYCNKILNSEEKYLKLLVVKKEPEKMNSFENLSDIYKEPEIQLIDEKIDVSKLELIPYDWDIDVNGVKYDLYRIPGFAHTIGGKYGIYDLWACPRGETPTNKNLIEYRSYHACRWGFRVNANHYIKTKWDETSINSRVVCTITRNDKDFYTFNTRDIDYAIAKAQTLLVELSEFPISFHSKNYIGKIIGRKIYYNHTPAIITRLIEEDLDLIINTEDGYEFPIPIHMLKCINNLSKEEQNVYFNEIQEWKDEGCNIEIKDSLFSENIWWFRT